MLCKTYIAYNLILDAVIPEGRSHWDVSYSGMVGGQVLVESATGVQVVYNDCMVSCKMKLWAYVDECQTLFVALMK